MQQNIEKNNQIREDNIQRMKEKEININNNLYNNQMKKDEMMLKKKQEELELYKHHQENLDWNDFQKDKSNQQIFEKHSKIDKFLSMNETTKKRHQEAIHEQQKNKEQEIKEQREYFQNKKVNDTLNYINEKQNAYIEIMKKKNEDIIKTRKEKDLKDEQKMEKMSYERSKMENNKRDNLMRELNEKEKKYEENRNEARKKEKEKYDLLRQQKEEKEKIKHKFEDLMTKNKGEINIEKIKKLIPDDEELHERLEQAKKEFEQKKSKQIDAYERDKVKRRQTLSKNKSKSINNMSKNSSNKIKRTNTANRSTSSKYNITIMDIPKVSGKEILNENKIKFMVEDYHKKLMKDFYVFLNKEKKVQKERNELFKEAETEKEKKRLEKIFAMQRGQSEDKIGEYNNMIDEKLKIYEEQLRKIYEKQKK